MFSPGEQAHGEVNGVEQIFKVSHLIILECFQKSHFPSQLKEIITTFMRLFSCMIQFSFQASYHSTWSLFCFWLIQRVLMWNIRIKLYRLLHQRMIDFSFTNNLAKTILFISWVSTRSRRPNSRSSEIEFPDIERD